MVDARSWGKVILKDILLVGNHTLSLHYNDSCIGSVVLEMTRDTNMLDHWWISGSGSIELISGSLPISVAVNLESSANSLYQIESLKAEVHSDQATILTTLEGLSSYNGQLSAKIGTQSMYYNSTIPGPLQLVRTSTDGFGIKLPFSGLGLATSNLVAHRFELSPDACDHTTPLEVHGLLSTLSILPPDEKNNP